MRQASQALGPSRQRWVKTLWIASTWRWRRGWKASTISKLDTQLSKIQESRYTTASSVSYLQPSVGTPWNPTTTARESGTFRSALSEATHDEWTVRQILVHLGLFSGIRRLREDVTEFHARQDIVLTSQHGAPSRRLNSKAGCLLGVTNSRAKDKIRMLTVFKTLFLSDIVLKLFHVWILSSPEWTLGSLPMKLANSQTSAFELFKEFTGPFSELVIWEE